MHVLMYHNVRASALGAAPAAGYAVTDTELASHMRAVAEAVAMPPAILPDALLSENVASRWAITFDDGKADNLLAADILEAQGWRAHFFVITNRIGTDSYLTRRQILDLHRRGHCIGSHTASHPRSMASLSFDELRTEWRGSVDVLSELLGEPVRVASVPGGSYSPTVAAAAAHAGLSVLFTSNPSSRFETVDGCSIAGRYLIGGNMKPSLVADLAAGRWLPRFSQAVRWKTRSLVSAALGQRYDQFRGVVRRVRKA